MIDSCNARLFFTEVPPPLNRVLLVDDHAVVRKGLAMLINIELDMHVCGEACR